MSAVMPHARIRPMMDTRSIVASRYAYSYGQGSRAAAARARLAAAALAPAVDAAGRVEPAAVTVTSRNRVDRKTIIDAERHGNIEHVRITQLPIDTAPPAIRAVVGLHRTGEAVSHGRSHVSKAKKCRLGHGRAGQARLGEGIVSEFAEFVASPAQCRVRGGDRARVTDTGTHRLEQAAAHYLCRCAGRHQLTSAKLADVIESPAEELASDRPGAGMKCTSRHLYEHVRPQHPRRLRPRYQAAVAELPLPVISPAVQGALI